jgi:hypothetical protein
MLQMYGQYYHVIRMQLRGPESRYCRAISGKIPSWARLVINLVQRRNGQDQTQNFRKQ